jgi:ribosomal protein S18 acetylase RimI-like enzyme
MPHSVVIRPATSAVDIAAVRALISAYMASLDVDLAYQGADTELATLPGKYAPPAGALLLAVDAGGHPVGCVALRPFGVDGDCEMKRLYVMPEARAQKLGRRLSEAIIAEARRRGYRRLLLDTLPGMTTAQNTYRALGFREIAAYYPTPVAGTMFMALDL